MRVRYTVQAHADLEEIGDWIARDNPNRAAAFVVELREACESLSAHARRHPVAFSRPGGQIRKKTYRRYLVFYRIVESEAQILRVVHGSRDWAALLAETD